MLRRRSKTSSVTKRRVAQVAIVCEPARTSSQKLSSGVSRLQRGSKAGLTKALGEVSAMVEAQRPRSASTLSEYRCSSSQDSA